MTEGYECYTATPASESGLQSDKKGGNQQFPDVLSEQPTAAERKTWVETAVRNMSETQRSLRVARDSKTRIVAKSVCN